MTTATDRWATRPKPPVHLQEPEIGWAAARQLQAKRRQIMAATRRQRPATAKAAGIGALVVGRALDELQAQQQRESCPVEQAATALRRRIVYRMSVTGGDPDLFFVSGLGRDLTASDLILAAGKLAA